MGRQSSIKGLEPPVRAYIERLLREDRLTLDELLAAVREKYPEAETPSRSSLHRYKSGFEELAGRMREIEAASAAMVGELGEGMGDRAGALLAQAVTTLATHAALNAQADENELSIKEVAALARAAKAAMEARTMSVRERQAVEKAAQERLLREQNKKLEQMGKSGSIAPETLKTIRREVYGII
jgi:hypothetical protein